MKILKINDLNVSLNNKKIINNLNLKINPGEKHIIMGPNGAGKSTLAKILTGDNKNYNITGEIIYKNKNLLEMEPEDISLNGVFLGFQYPLEIQGLTNFQFFKSFVNVKRKNNNLEPVDNEEFTIEIKKKMEDLNIKEDFLYRSVNEGFSGGEKKKNEILQMMLINPDLIILDEIDSGLDIDSLKIVCKSINSFLDKEKSLLAITHYIKILDYINVDFVHIIKNGNIIKTGNKSLAININNDGYFSN